MPNLSKISVPSRYEIWWINYYLHLSHAYVYVLLSTNTHAFAHRPAIVIDCSDHSPSDLHLMLIEFVLLNRFVRVEKILPI